jgi:hypothetical protein
VKRDLVLLVEKFLRVWPTFPDYPGMQFDLFLYRAVDQADSRLLIIVRESMFDMISVPLHRHCHPHCGGSKQNEAIDPADVSLVGRPDRTKSVGPQLWQLAVARQGIPPMSGGLAEDFV